MTVAETSREAFRIIQGDGTAPTQKDLIIACLRYEAEKMTRREIADYCGLELGAASGRVNALVAEGRLEEVGTTKCQKTGKTVGLVRLVDVISSPEDEYRAKCIERGIEAERESAA